MSELKIPDNVYDVLIIGGGPAGLASGLYLSRGGMNTVLIESFSVMGQATMTDTIENYPGIDNIGGFDLLSVMKSQTQKFGLKCQQGTVSAIERVSGQTSGWKAVYDGGEIKALSVIIASGARPRKLNIPGEKEFTGSGVSYCATCDGAFFKGKEVIVVGGGDAAVEEAVYLTKFAEKVTIVHRRDRLRASRVIQDKAFSNKKIDFIWSSNVEKISGSGKVDKITVKNVSTGAASEVKCDGVFIFIGWNPNTGFLKGLVDMSVKGRISVNDDMGTSAEGIFAAGDCREKLLYQVVTACGDGATAAFAAQRYVENLKGTAYDQKG
jgi:thioredoxin reductase (NADPH)